MEKNTIRHLEKAALAGGIVVAIGGTAYASALKLTHKPNPGILNDERFDPGKRMLLNLLAVEVLYSYMPSRQQLVNKLSFKVDQVSHLMGYLTGNGLVVNQPGSKKAETPVHYAPTYALGEALLQPELYPSLEAARQERDSPSRLSSDNS